MTNYIGKKITEVANEEEMRNSQKKKKKAYNKLTNCRCCKLKDSCIHAGCFRRLPKSQGGLGLCPNLII